MELRVSSSADIFKTEHEETTLTVQWIHFGVSQCFNRLYSLKVQKSSTLFFLFISVTKIYDYIYDNGTTKKRTKHNKDGARLLLNHIFLTRKPTQMKSFSFRTDLI